MLKDISQKKVDILNNLNYSLKHKRTSLHYNVTLFSLDCDYFVYRDKNMSDIYCCAL